MYRFNSSEKEVINNFNSENNKGHIFQTSLWCDFKEEWDQYYIKGEDSNGNIALTCSLLTRKLPYINKYIGYIPRGFVCDYRNRSLIEEFAIFLTAFAKANNISFVTIDPDIHLKENEINLSAGKDILNILNNAGFVFKESDSKNFEAIQPKFAFRLDISPQDNETSENTKERIYKNFHKKWRYNINLGKQRFLEVESYDKHSVTEELLDEFQRIMEITGERDGFLVRNKNYFKNLICNVSPGSRLYMVKYNLQKDKEATLSKIEKLQKEMDILEEKISQFINRLNTEETTTGKHVTAHLKDTKNVATKLEQIDKLKIRLSKINEIDKEYIYLSGAIYLYYGNKAWYLYGASSNDFRDTMPNFSMQWAMISDSIDLGKKVYDFRGVSGDLNESNPLYGLYKFKKGFGGDFVEFIGEGNLIIDKPIHSLFNGLFPKFKKIRGKFRKK